jgi:hypothetical protein
MAVQNSLTLDQPRQVATAPVESMISRQAQEVQAAMVVAKRFPRDVNDSISRIEKACERPTLAEVAAYEYERGGSEVTGPSIRLAETLAQNWGNLDFGVVELEQRNGESTVMAYAWDLETNTRQTKIFQVPHVRKTKQGSKLLDDPRDVYEMVANQGARRLRACILGIIPGDIVDFALGKCEQTLAAGKKKIPLAERTQKMVAAFAAIDVSESQLAKFIGKESVKHFSEQDLDRLRKVFAAIKDNLTRKEDQFPPIAKQEQKEVAEEVAPTDSGDEFPL